MAVWGGRTGQKAFELVHHDCHQICGDQRMNNAREIHSAHPLFRELRNGLLWHCTSPEKFLQIRTCGFIKPNDKPNGTYDKRPAACQALSGVPLFDFTTKSEMQIFETQNIWQQFLRRTEPVTVILGLKQDRLPGRVVQYPELRDITRPLNCTDPIPWVEACHIGQIPISAIACYLLVCAADYSRFKKLESLNEADVDHAATVCSEAARTRSEGQFNVQKFNQSPEFKAQMEQMRRQVENPGGKPNHEAASNTK